MAAARRSVSLSVNQLSGSIPDGVFNLTMLTSVPRRTVAFPCVHWAVILMLTLQPAGPLLQRTDRHAVTKHRQLHPTFVRALCVYLWLLLGFAWEAVFVLSLLLLLLLLLLQVPSAAEQLAVWPCARCSVQYPDEPQVHLLFVCLFVCLFVWFVVLLQLLLLLQRAPRFS